MRCQWCPQKLVPWFYLLPEDVIFGPCHASHLLGESGGVLLLWVLTKYFSLTFISFPVLRDDRNSSSLDSHIVLSFPSRCFSNLDRVFRVQDILLYFNVSLASDFLVPCVQTLGIFWSFFLNSDGRESIILVSPRAKGLLLNLHSLVLPEKLPFSHVAAARLGVWIKSWRLLILILLWS